MKVWIDQDLCTGDGLCTDHAPDVFASRHNGIVAAMSTLAANPIHRYGPASARRCAVGAPGASSRAIVTANLRRRVALGAARGRANYGVNVVAPDASLGGVPCARQERVAAL